jgi:magnesium transporter
LEPYSIVASIWDGDVSAREASLEEALAAEANAWIHVHAHDVPGTTALLVDRFGFHPLAVEDALSDTERPALHDDDAYLFLSVSAVTRDDKREVYTEIGFFLSKNRLVTVSRSDCPTLQAGLERWRRRPARYGQTLSFLLHSLLDEIVDAYFPASDALEDAVDGLGDLVFKSKSAPITEIIRVKRRLLEMRRHIAPMRDILNGCLRRDIELIDDRARPFFQDVYDHTLRLIEVVDTNREILASILEAHLAVVSNSLNIVMRTMTVISTCLMTAALVAGVYGMNFEFMPELAWVGGYPFALALMVGLVLLELWFFRKRGWI